MSRSAFVVFFVGGVLSGCADSPAEWVLLTRGSHANDDGATMMGSTSKGGGQTMGDLSAGHSESLSATGTDPTADGMTGADGACGDGAVDPGEGCDDGPGNGPGQACKLDCTANVCSDGDEGPGEGCDNGIDNANTGSCKLDCQPADCGDGYIGPGEGCDDGNAIDDDTCSNLCKAEGCGDGEVAATEMCDDGNAIDDDECTSNCTLPACGDAVVQPSAGETCDAGVDNSDMAVCTLDCVAAVCGDGLVFNDGGAEVCDLGANNGPGQACNAMCLPNVCGDGDKSGAEGCDDGNTIDEDGCSAGCTLEGCGDGEVDAGEGCDDGKDGDNDDDCTDLCQLPACGDGFVQASAGEACDEGVANSDGGACTLLCAQAVCGDDLVWLDAEQCDNGASNGPGQTCNAMCKTNICGDGDPGPGEGCDDGNTSDADACTNVCKLASCGDGFVQPGEGCDLGDLNDNFGECTLNCTLPTCGDGFSQGAEECDAGPGNGNSELCTAGCTVATCGDGFTWVGFESCDDGNDVNDDECPNDCFQYCTIVDYVVCDDALDPADKADKTQALAAMGICDDLPTNSVQITEFQFTAPDGGSWTVARGFGSYVYDHDMDPNTPEERLYSPREGDRMLMISTGAIAPPNDEGIVLQGGDTQKNGGANGNPDLPDTLPAPLSPLKGSAEGMGGTPFEDCDDVNDCSDSLADAWALGESDPNDALYFRFDVKAPPGVYVYTFDFAICSAEYPERVGMKFNDMAIVWHRDPSDLSWSFTGNRLLMEPSPGVIVPLAVTSLAPYFEFKGAAPQLADTGFVGSACTDWRTTKGYAAAGAELTLGFYLADMGDDVGTTTVLLDNFRWVCEGCIPSEVDDCGSDPPP
jgi:cysteine-rich repeat protein